MITSLMLALLTCSDPEWSISFSQYKIYKDGLIAVSKDHHVCLVIPDDQEILFFAPDTKLLRRHKSDSDAPDGFRQITSVGYDYHENLFYVYDFGRKISFWRSNGEFAKVVILKPLLFKPYMNERRDIIYVSDDSGDIHSTPSIRIHSNDGRSEETLLKMKTLNQVNGYPHKSIPGPPVKMPWHFQMFLASGMGYFVACYNAEQKLYVFDDKTMKLQRTISFALPTVPVDEVYFKRILKDNSKILGVKPNDLIIKDHAPFHPVPLQVLVSPDDKIFIYCKSFDGFLRVQYNLNGLLRQKSKQEAIPQFINTDYHYFLRPAGISLVIKRSKP